MAHRESFSVSALCYSIKCLVPPLFTIGAIFHFYMKLDNYNYFLTS